MTGPAPQDRFVIHGRLHVALDAVARCYNVRVEWLEEVYEHGLLGSGERIDGRIAVAASQLDRVARIVNLHFHAGANLSAIVLLLPLE